MINAKNSTPRMESLSPGFWPLFNSWSWSSHLLPRPVWDKWDKHPFRVYLTGFLKGWDRIDVIAHGEMIQTGKVEHDPAWPRVPRSTWELSSVSAWVLGDGQTPKELRNNYFAIVGFSHFYYLTARTMVIQYILYIFGSTNTKCLLCTRHCCWTYRAGSKMFL